MYGAAQSMVVTNGSFTRDAAAWGKRHGILLVDREALLAWRRTPTTSAGSSRSHRRTEHGRLPRWAYSPPRPRLPPWKRRVRVEGARAKRDRHPKGGLSALTHWVERERADRAVPSSARSAVPGSARGNRPVAPPGFCCRTPPCRTRPRMRRWKGQPGLSAPARPGRPGIPLCPNARSSPPVPCQRCSPAPPSPSC
nr:restriction endonuclease [Streptomyces sp. ISL-66]